ncbi:LytTR family DNA-binding domain-containing protein [Emticicia sp. 17c]|uniref:LytTR family DNA-binding domain-containing protein n=1 Tax=Emticicia sp. 17c TaxID=3127704 RepID=UPI00301BF1C5
MENENVNLSVRTIVAPSEVIFFEANINYTLIHYLTHSEIVAISLKQVEQRVKEFRFCRIHKSYLVNLDYIASVNSRYELEMANKRSLAIARRKAATIRRMMKSKRAA